MAVRELTETEVEVFEEELAEAAQALESREERIQEVFTPKNKYQLIFSLSGFSWFGGTADVAWSNRS